MAPIAVLASINSVVLHMCCFINCTDQLPQKSRSAALPYMPFLFNSRVCCSISGMCTLSHGVHS